MEGEHWLKHHQPPRAHHRSSLITPNDRWLTYAASHPGHLKVENGILQCAFCNVPLDHHVKSTIDTHLRSNKHLKNAEITNLESNIPQPIPLEPHEDYTANYDEFTISSQSHISEAQEDNEPQSTHYENEVKSWEDDELFVEAMLRSQICTRTFQEPRTSSFWINTFGQSNLTETLVSLSDRKKQEIRSCLSSKNILLFIEEITDENGYYAFNVFAIELGLDNHQYFLNTVKVHECNKVSFCQNIVSLISDYQIPFNNIKLMSSTLYSLELALFHEHLSVLLPNSRFVLPFSALLTAIEGIWARNFPAANNWIKTFEMFIISSPNLVGELNSYLLYKCKIAVKYAPFNSSGNGTQWWFKNVRFHAKHFNREIEFLKMVYQRNPLCSSQLTSILEDNELLSIMNNELSAISLYSEGILQKTSFLQAHLPALTQLQKNVDKLVSHLEIYPKFEHNLINKIDTAMKETSGVCHQFFEQKFTNTSTLDFEFIKAISFFDPSQMLLNETALGAFSELSEVPVNEMDMYRNLSSSAANSTFNVQEFWKNHQFDLPSLFSLALPYISNVISLTITPNVHEYCEGNSSFHQNLKFLQLNLNEELCFNEEAKSSKEVLYDCSSNVSPSINTNYKKDQKKDSCYLKSRSIRMRKLLNAKIKKRCKTRSPKVNQINSLIKQEVVDT